MSKSPKTSYHHGDLRQALIDAGLKVLAGEGLEALSLRRVAREAAVSASAPYRHFKDKQALLAAISENGFRQLQAMLAESNEKTPGDLDASGRAYISFAIENPQSYRLMFTNRVLCDENAEESLKEAGQEAFLALVETIEAGIKAGGISETESHQLGLAAWSLVHGVAMLVIDGIFERGAFADLSAEQILSVCQAHFKNGWEPTL